VRKLAVLLVLMMIVVSALGCQSSQRSVARNANYLVDDTMRCVGLDQPSALHPRDLEPWDSYEAYRGYP
jgi:hypothetical protein